MSDYARQRASWIDSDAAHRHGVSPSRRAPTMAGPPGYPADQLTFGPSAFADPQGAQTFAAVQWRAAEIIWPGLPGDRPDQRNRYEIEATWVSAELPTITTITLPNGVCRPGITCRVRVRMKDNSGRWSHWSAPAEFVAWAAAREPGPVAARHRIDVSSTGSRECSCRTTGVRRVAQCRDSTELDLSNLHFSAGIGYQFPVGARLAPQAYYVLAADPRPVCPPLRLSTRWGIRAQSEDSGERLTLAGCLRPARLVLCLCGRRRVAQLAPTAAAIPWF